MKRKPVSIRIVSIVMIFAFVFGQIGGAALLANASSGYGRDSSTIAGERSDAPATKEQQRESRQGAGAVLKVLGVITQVVNFGVQMASMFVEIFSQLAMGDLMDRIGMQLSSMGEKLQTMETRLTYVSNQIIGLENMITAMQKRELNQVQIGIKEQQNYINIYFEKLKTVLLRHNIAKKEDVTKEKIDAFRVDIKNFFKSINVDGAKFQDYVTTMVVLYVGSDGEQTQGGLQTLMNILAMNIESGSMSFDEALNYYNNYYAQAVINVSRAMIFLNAYYVVQADDPAAFGSVFKRITEGYLHPMSVRYLNCVNQLAMKYADYSSSSNSGADLNLYRTTYSKVRGYNGENVKQVLKVADLLFAVSRTYSKFGSVQVSGSSGQTVTIDNTLYSDPNLGLIVRHLSEPAENVKNATLTVAASATERLVAGISVDPTTSKLDVEYYRFIPVKTHIDWRRPKATGKTFSPGCRKSGGMKYKYDFMIQEFNVTSSFMGDLYYIAADVSKGAGKVNLQLADGNAVNLTYSAADQDFYATDPHDENHKVTLNFAYLLNTNDVRVVPYQDAKFQYCTYLMRSLGADNLNYWPALEGASQGKLKVKFPGRYCGGASRWFKYEILPCVTGQTGIGFLKNNGQETVDIQVNGKAVIDAATNNQYSKFWLGANFYVAKSENSKPMPVIADPQAINHGDKFSFKPVPKGVMMEPVGKITGQQTLSKTLDVTSVLTVDGGSCFTPTVTAYQYFWTQWLGLWSEKLYTTVNVGWNEPTMTFSGNAQKPITVKTAMPSETRKGPADESIVFLYLGRSAGEHEYYELDNNNGQYKLLGIADFDGVGGADLAVYDAADKVIYYIDSAVDNASPVPDEEKTNPWKKRLTGQIAPTYLVLYTLNDGDSFVDVADINGDGYDDVILTDSNGDIKVVYVVSGSASSEQTFAVGSDGYSVVGRADINGNSDDELILIGPDRAFYACGFTGNSYELTRLMAAPGSENWQLVGTGDFDGNGYDDLIWRCMDPVTRKEAGTKGNILFQMMGNSEEEQLVQPKLKGNPTAKGYDIAEIADLNGDGKDDILLKKDKANGGSVFYVCFLNGAECLKKKYWRSGPLRINVPPLIEMFE